MKPTFANCNIDHFAAGMDVSHKGRKFRVVYVTNKGAAYCTNDDNGSYWRLWPTDLPDCTLYLDSMWVGRRYYCGVDRTDTCYVEMVNDRLVSFQCLNGTRVARTRTEFLRHWNPLPLDPPSAEQQAPAAPEKEPWKPEVGTECEWFAKGVMKSPVVVTPVLYDPECDMWVIRERGTAIYHGVKDCVLRPLPPEPLSAEQVEELWRGRYAWVLDEQGIGRPHVINKLSPLPPDPPVQVGEWILVECQTQKWRVGKVLAVGTGTFTLGSCDHGIDCQVGYDKEGMKITHLMPKE